MDSPCAKVDTPPPAPAPHQCQFWLPNKRRFCANSPLPISRFCGNHNPDATGARVSCPIDPSHSVAKGSLDSHLKRCPFRKRALELESLTYYQKGINAGVDSCESVTVSSEAKRAAINRMSVPDFCELVQKIKSLHCSLSGKIRDSYAVSKSCDVWFKRQQERQLPFQEKHALQQASIVGNMEIFGLLKKASDLEAFPNSGDQTDDDNLSGMETDPAVVEFGAGRGYLTQMLADCYGASKIFLVERRSYKMKADRSLRQCKNTIFERLRIDIQDLKLSAIEALREHPFLAIGKHICGSATDLTLRCCLSGGDDSEESIPPCGNHNLKGLALATCCHHLCQWQHYTNKNFFTDLGLTKDDFHAITWFSSWAVDADHSSDMSDPINYGKELNVMETWRFKMEGCVETTMKNMKAVDRAILGFMCKDIIDLGRLLWLQDHGLNSCLVNYVPLNVSPENHLLVAKW